MSIRTLGRPFTAVLATLAWLWLGAIAVSAQPADVDDGDVRSSFSELDRYGQWVEHPEWGTVWSPEVDDNWRPYTMGRWIYTEEHGWYWDSEEPFGWAVYHYGRWLNDPDEGWIWIPGTEWGPAWVAWREGEDSVGWAPLPPEAIWDTERGVVIEDTFYSSPRWAPYWVFLPARFLLSPGLHRHVHPYRRDAVWFRSTRPVTHYHWRDRRIFNRGIAPDRVERWTRSRVAPVRLLAAQRPSVRRGGSGDVYVYRPTIVTSDRWRAGRTGDWRRFEPQRRDVVRHEREFRSERRGSLPDGQRRLDRPDGRGDGREGTSWRDRPPFDRDRRDRDGRGDRSTSVPSVPRAPGIDAPSGDRARPPFDRGDRNRQGEGPSTGQVPRGDDGPRQRFDAPRRFPEGDRARDPRLERPREDGRRGEGGDWERRRAEERARQQQDQRAQELRQRERDSQRQQEQQARQRAQQEGQRSQEQVRQRAQQEQARQQQRAQEQARQEQQRAQERQRRNQQEQNQGQPGQPGGPGGRRG